MISKPYLYLLIFIFNLVFYPSITQATTLDMSGLVVSGMPMYNPTPPEKNPHPPQTEEDKERVKFALESVKRLLTDKDYWKNQKRVLDRTPFHAKSRTCIRDIKCVEKDRHFILDTKNIYNKHGVVIETKHAHIIPWAFKNFELKTKPISITHEELSGDSEESVRDEVAREPMPAPALNPNEYLIHIYAKFSKKNAWYHLDVIIEETPDGKLFFKYFFVAPFYNESGSLPPGVVC